LELVARVRAIADRCARQPGQLTAMGIGAGPNSTGAAAGASNNCLTSRLSEALASRLPCSSLAAISRQSDDAFVVLLLPATA
jgi:hypothetical protein